MPGRLEYDEAMLFSAIRLKVQDSDLKQGKVEMLSAQTAQGSIDRPWGIEGGFAVVYKFRRKSGALCALRCFRVPMNPDTQFRYGQLGPYFHAHAPNITAGFKYYDAAIMVKEQGKAQSKAFPVIEMDWIEGVTLAEKVDKLCRKSDRGALKDLAERWLALLSTMQQARIAHGDLAGVNVMVRDDGRLVLIDYDGSYIPDFAGLSAVLVGQDDFQHPQMAQRGFHEHIDAFSALVIYTALVALAVKPKLWNTYEKFDAQHKLIDFNLLFRKQDFQDPQQSPLFKDLEQLGDGHVQAMAHELRRMCQLPINDLKFPFALVDPLYQQKQARALLSLAFQSLDLEQIAAAQPFLHYTITELERQRIERAVTFMQTYKTGDDQALLAAYTILRQDPEPDFFILTAEQQRRITLIQRHEEALIQFRQALTSRSPWRTARSYDAILDQSAQVTKIELERLVLARMLTEALRTNDYNQLLATDSVVQQSPHRDFFLLTPEERQRFAFAHEQKKAVLTFHTALQGRRPREIIAAHSPLLATGQALTQEELSQLDMARRFVQAWNADDDEALLAVDQALQAAYNLFLLTPAEQQRFMLARERMQALHELRLVLQSTPEDARRIGEVYNPSLLHASSPLRNDERELVEAALQYGTMYAAVQAGLHADDDDLIRHAFDPALAQRFTGITPAEQQRIDRAMITQALENLLDSGAYEQAIQQARSLQQGHGQGISHSLIFKLQRATLRFIRDYDLYNLAVQIEEYNNVNYATVSWQWPAHPLIQVGLLTWQTRTWPERPSELCLNDPNWPHIWVRQKNNVLYGRHTFLIGNETHVYIKGYAAIRDTWDHDERWRFSAGRDPTASAEATSPSMIRRIP